MHPYWRTSTLHRSKQKYVYRDVSLTLESLFKSHEKTILPIISPNTKITTQQWDKFNEEIEGNANRMERLEKQNHNFSESLSTCLSIQDDKVE